MSDILKEQIDYMIRVGIQFSETLDAQAASVRAILDEKGWARESREEGILFAKRIMVAIDRAQKEVKGFAYGAPTLPIIKRVHPGGMKVIEDYKTEVGRREALRLAGVPQEAIDRGLYFCQRVTVRERGNRMLVTGRYLYRMYPGAAAEPTSYRFYIVDGKVVSWAKASRQRDGEWATQGGGAMSVFDEAGEETDGWFVDKWGWSADGLKEFDRVAFQLLRQKGGAR